jgi:MFS family permease
VEHSAARQRFAAGGAYPWLVVGLLWCCGFFNYADRQAVFAVFPLIQGEFRLSDDQLGWVGSAFMAVYAATAPLAGFVVDRFSRKGLIVAGLGFWSLVCAATGACRSYVQLLVVRAAEGLGETFYFPASMSLLADYHGPRTRSRAMSLHQTSVYLGTAGGAYIAGNLGERFGWRSPFLVLGFAGTLYAAWLAFSLIEPERGASEPGKAKGPDSFSELDAAHASPLLEASLREKVARIVRNPAALALLAVFIGANFVASTFLTWLPTFIGRKFTQGLSASALISTAWPLASMAGALCGGMLADWAAGRSRGGRIRIQSLGLIAGAPFVYGSGNAATVPVLIAALVGAGLCKGIYDANIFAALFDVIEPEDRGTAAGLMNSVGWTGGFLAPPVVGYASKAYGLSVAIASTAAVYLVVGFLAMVAARLAEVRAASPGKSAVAGAKG